MQRIGCGNQRHEIRLRPGSNQPINGTLSELFDVGFDQLQILGHEPFLGQPPQFGMLGRIERHQRLDKIGRSAGDLPRQILARAVGQDGRARAVEEGRIVLADPHHIFVAGNQPERRMIVGRAFDTQHRGFRPDLVKQVEQRIPCRIGFGIDHRDGGFGLCDGCVHILKLLKRSGCLCCPNIRHAAAACRACPSHGAAALRGSLSAAASSRPTGSGGDRP